MNRRAQHVRESSWETMRLGIAIGLVLLVVLSITGCASNPCVVSPGSLACNKQEAAKLVYRTTYKRCMYEWREQEREELGVYGTIYRPCGDATICCIATARLAAERVRK